VVSLNAFSFSFRPYVSGRRVFISGIAAFIIGILLGSLLWNIGGLPKIPTPSPPTSIGPSTIFYNSECVGRDAFSAVLPEVTIEINVSQYELPVDLNEVNGFAELKAWFGITSEQEELLSENGFVVLRVNQFETLGDAYDYIIDNSLPLLITTDAVLHSYHVLFDETLKRAEMNELISKMNRTIERLLSEAQKEAQTYVGTALEEAANINFMYLEVAQKLINPGFSPTSEQAVQELELICAHADIFKSPIFGYKEDYSQYVPRGHYTENERLKAYFKTMMWLGRMRFCPLPSLNLEVDIEGVRKQTRAAILLTWMVRNTDVYDNWMRVYDVTKFFVGVSDDLTFEDYFAVLEEMSINHPEQLYSDDRVDEFAQEVVQRSKAKILGTYAETYPWMPQEKELDRILEETSGLRFMGQRFIPDSYMFQQLVYPQVGTWSKPRLLPKSLDIPAVLGSEPAEEILNQTEAQFLNYTVQLNKLRLEFQGLTVRNWTRNLYWSGLYTLNTTLETIPSTYPTFMTTEPWSYEKLQTFAGSWTELRHDTILYAKQSYTPSLRSVPSPPPPNTAYVEPYPQTYRRLTGLLNMTLNGLEELQLLSEDIEDSLRDFREILGLFLTASILELEGEDLSQDMQEEIREAAGKFATILDVASEKTQKATIAADVHTDPNTDPPRALEEALGKFNVLVIIYSDNDGNLYASAGPAYNYFEFTQPIAERLTDEAWVELLSTDPPQPPDWTSEFAA
jgi:hypothetical protein